MRSRWELTEAEKEAERRNRGPVVADSPWAIEPAPSSVAPPISYPNTPKIPPKRQVVVNNYDPDEYRDMLMGVTPISVKQFKDIPYLPDTLNRKGPLAGVNLGKLNFGMNPWDLNGIRENYGGGAEANAENFLYRELEKRYSGDEEKRYSKDRATEAMPKNVDPEFPSIFEKNIEQAMDPNNTERKVKFIYDPTKRGYGGATYPLDKRIEINTGSYFDPWSTLLHELNHRKNLLPNESEKSYFTEGSKPHFKGYPEYGPTVDPYAEGYPEKKYPRDRATTEWDTMATQYFKAREALEKGQTVNPDILIRFPNLRNIVPFGKENILNRNTPIDFSVDPLLRPTEY